MESIQVMLPFEAVEVLRQSPIQSEYPDVWSRFISHQTVRYTRHHVTTLYTNVSWHDLTVIRNHLAYWLATNEANSRLSRPVRQAIAGLSVAVHHEDVEPTRPVEHPV